MIDGVQLELTGPDDAERLPPRITVDTADGMWTPGPHAVLEAGNQLELTLAELQWLRDTGIPAAIGKLTELAATKDRRE